MAELIRFVARRLAQGIAVVYVVATATFVLLRVVPGGPFDREKQLPPEVKANIARKYHLDAPVTRQYLDYLVDLSHLDFGPSLRFPGRSVGEILAEGLPVSATIGAAGLALAVAFGVVGGVAAYQVRSGAGSVVVAVLLVVGMCVPSFVLAVALIEVFAMRLGIVPPALWEGFRYGVLPVLTLALAPGVYLARLTRSELLELETREFVQTARAKGLAPVVVLLKHQLRPALLAMVTMLGPLAATLCTGSFVVEHMFALPGAGRHFVTAVIDRDYPMVMAVTVIYASALVIANLAVDVAAAALDPRVRLEGKGA